MFRRRRKPVEIELNEPADGASEGAIEGARVVETKPVRTRGSEAQRSYDEVMGLVRRIGDHLENQNERTERLLGLMDRLPPALESLPEISRQNARVLEALHEHMAQTRAREETMNSALITLTDTSGRQTEVLGLIQQQVEASSQSAGHLTQTLGSLQGALSDMSETSNRSANVLARMADETAQRETELSGALLKSQRWIVAAVVCCGVASIAAMLVAVLAISN